MTFEDDQREKFRKDLIKALPIEVQEDSEDERWGFSTHPQQQVIPPQIYNAHSLLGGNTTGYQTEAGNFLIDK